MTCLPFKELEKEDQPTKAHRRKERIKARAEILKDNIKTTETSVQNQIFWCGFFRIFYI